MCPIQQQPQPQPQPQLQLQHPPVPLLPTPRSHQRPGTRQLVPIHKPVEYLAPVFNASFLPFSSFDYPFDYLSLFWGCFFMTLLWPRPDWTDSRRSVSIYVPVPVPAYPFILSFGFPCLPVGFHLHGVGFIPCLHFNMETFAFKA